MSRAWWSLRVQLAVFGFLAIYLPVLILVGVFWVTEQETVEVRNGVEITDVATRERSPMVTWTAVALGPIGAGLAWWWSGRAVRPLHEAAESQRRWVEEIGHELRTPLSVLATNADVLLAHPSPTAETYRQGLERTKSATARLRSAVDELLVVARGRVRSIDRRPADLMEIARGVVDDARVVAAAKEITVSLAGASAAGCSVDEPTVRRAIANLVDNAIRYAPAGTAIEVTVEVTAETADAVVTDHGPGIPADRQERIFERFWRGRSDSDGAGLGLPIARQVASAHGGDLTVQSPGPDGTGCVFRLTLRRRRCTDLEGFR